MLQAYRRDRGFGTFLIALLLARLLLSGLIAVLPWPGASGPIAGVNSITLLMYIASW